MLVAAPAWEQAALPVVVQRAVAQPAPAQVLALVQERAQVPELARVPVAARPRRSVPDVKMAAARLRAASRAWAAGWACRSTRPHPGQSPLRPPQTIPPRAMRSTAWAQMQRAKHPRHPAALQPWPGVAAS